METMDGNTPTVSTEQTEAPASGQSPVEPTQGTAQTQEETFFDPKGLSPELEQAYKQMQASYTKKTQEIADVRKKAESLDQLIKYDPFVKWYNKHLTGGDPVEQLAPKPESNRESPKGPTGLFEDLTDDEYQLLSADKAKFGKYMQQKIIEQASQVALPVAQAAKQKVEYLENLSKIERFAQEHSDFWDLDSKGLIEPLIEKHPGLDIEDVYKLAKFPYLQQEAIQKAHQMVQDKKNATVERPGLGIPSAGKVKVKSREEAMNMAWDYHARGQTPPDFEIVR